MRLDFNKSVRKTAGLHSVITMKYLSILAMLIVASGCSVNYHIRPKGACPTEGVSPLASNCPTPEEMKQGAGTTKTTQKQ